jgi:hydroxylamine dehydrogenase
MKRILVSIACFIGLGLVSAYAEQPATSAASCIDCHSKKTPNIVSDWKVSKHSAVEVTCVTCHGDQHNSDSDVPKVRIPTPDTCEQCHATQVQQFKKGKHALAWAAMKAMPTIHWQPMAMIEGQKGCGGCHKIGLKSLMEIVELRGESGTEFGAASCDACHTRHTFSAEEARQPQACETCHMGFDHPQWEMYSSSKHGVRSALKQLKVLPADASAPIAKPATCRKAIMKCGQRGDFWQCVCHFPTIKSGRQTGLRFYKRWGCSTHRANQPHSWRR